VACTCDVCGKKYKIDLVVSNDIWLKIRPDKSRPPEAGLMCPVCIMKVIEEVEGYGAYRLVSRMVEPKKKWWSKLWQNVKLVVHRLT
jgi:hypothetical protein